MWGYWLHDGVVALVRYCESVDRYPARSNPRKTHTASMGGGPTGNTAKILAHGLSHGAALLKLCRAFALRGLCSALVGRRFARQRQQSRSPRTSGKARGNVRMGARAGGLRLRPHADAPPGITELNRSVVIFAETKRAVRRGEEPYSCTATTPDARIAPGSAKSTPLLGTAPFAGPRDAERVEPVDESAP